MTISIVYSDYPGVLVSATVATSTDEEFVITLSDAGTISIVANDDATGDTVENSMSKEDLLDVIGILQQFVSQMT